MPSCIAAGAVCQLFISFVVVVVAVWLDGGIFLFCLFGWVYVGIAESGVVCVVIVLIKVVECVGDE